MSTKVAAIAIVISLIISALLINAGSQGSIVVNGWPLFALCAPIAFLLHWTFFIPSYILRTDHYFDLIGSTSYVATAITAAMLSPSLDLRGIIICSMVVIWATRLGLFLFTRIKQDGKDGRLDVIKTKFILFLNLWTIGGLWVLVTMGAGLAAMTSKTSLDIGVIGYIGIGLWIFDYFYEIKTVVGEVVIVNNNEGNLELEQKESLADVEEIVTYRDNEEEKVSYEYLFPDAIAKAKKNGTYDDTIIMSND